MLFTDSWLRKQTAGSNFPFPFNPSLLRHSEEHPSRTTVPKPSTAKQNRDLGFALGLFGRAALRCWARGFPIAPLLNRTALPSCSSWGAPAQIRGEAGAGGGSDLLFSPQTTEQTGPCDVLTNVLYFKFSTIIKDFVGTLRNFFFNLIDQSSTFNLFWRFQWFKPLEFPPATSPQGNPHRVTPAAAAVAGEHLPASPPTWPWGYQQHRSRGMHWNPTPGQLSLSAPPVYVVRETGPSTGIQRLTFHKARIRSFIIQSSISMTDDLSLIVLFLQKIK